MASQPESTKEVSARFTAEGVGEMYFERAGVTATVSIKAGRTTDRTAGEAGEADTSPGPSPRP